MTIRRGVMGSTPIGENGRVVLILPDDSTDLVDPRLTDAEILSRYDLDEIVRVPEIEFCTGLYLDGPMAGQTGYAVNEIGARTGVASATYQVTRLSEDGRPAELRFLESDPGT